LWYYEACQFFATKLEVDHTMDAREQVGLQVEVTWFFHPSFAEE
jgi:hypothetical protein